MNFNEYTRKKHAEMCCPVCVDRGNSNSLCDALATSSSTSQAFCDCFQNTDEMLMTTGYNQSVLRLDDAVVDSIISQYFEERGRLSSPSSMDESVYIGEIPIPDIMASESVSATGTDEDGDSTTGVENEEGIEQASSATTTTTTVLSQQGSDLSEKSGRNRKRQGRVKKMGKRTRARARPWSAEEHQRFEESLELYGRNWELCAAYIGTRRAPLVRSHAQKHLIKLWKLGIPLPKKLAESGSGYTLSGKPLLADSASAKSYLIKLPCPGDSELGDENYE